MKPPGRWGIDPARRRDSKADLAAARLEPALIPVFSVGVPGAGLKGLVDGVGRAVFGMSDDDGMGSNPPEDEENREGRVPARARLVLD
jgi:hypothetical protein